MPSYDRAEERCQKKRVLTGRGLSRIVCFLSTRGTACSRSGCIASKINRFKNTFTIVMLNSLLFLLRKWRFENHRSPFCLASGSGWASTHSTSVLRILYLLFLSRSRTKCLFKPLAVGIHQNTEMSVEKHSCRFQLSMCAQTIARCVKVSVFRASGGHLNSPNPAFGVEKTWVDLAWAKFECRNCETRTPSF